MLLSSTIQSVYPDELRCESNQLGLAIEYIKSRPSVRINIHFNEKDSIENLIHQTEILFGITANYTVSCDKFQLLRECLDNNIPSYFNFPVTDWETFTALVEWGVTDILIDGPLGFQMDLINSKKEKTLIRARPNASPNASICLGDNANSFFIRPEDLEKYSPYIDICEIYSDNKEKEEVIYNIYKRQSFERNLPILIPQLKINILNKYVYPIFADNRLNCNQKCKCGRSHCSLCSTTLSLTKLVTDYFEEESKPAIDINN